MSRRIDLVCEIDIEQTQTSFHAHAIPQNVEINPGDQILMYDAPKEIGFGEVFTGQRRATLIRANALERLWTRLRSVFEITELFETGFQPLSDALKMKG